MKPITQVRRWRKIQQRRRWLNQLYKDMTASEKLNNSEITACEKAYNAMSIYAEELEKNCNLVRK